MAQVVPQPLPAALAAGAAAAPPAIQQPPTTYGAKFANMGDLYQGAYLPFLEAYAPNAQLAPATVLQTALMALRRMEACRGFMCIRCLAPLRYARSTVSPKPLPYRVLLHRGTV